MYRINKSEKSTLLRHDIRGPVLDEAKRLMEQGVDVLRLNTGNPPIFGFSAPKEMLDSVKNQLCDFQAYSDSAGLYSAREAVARYSKEKGIDGVTAKNVYTGNGVSELIEISLSALLNDGDEVLLPRPDYPLWTNATIISGGKPVYYICDESSEWFPDLDDMRSKVTPKTRAIVIINPNNPTGALYPREILEGIVDIARENSLMIFSDEIYDRLVYDNKEHISIASLAPDLFCVTMNGLSKSHLICGFRCGWMTLSGNLEAAKSYIEAVNTIVSMRLCSNLPGQLAIEYALSSKGRQSTKDLISPGGRIYEQVKAACEELKNVDGLSYVAPKAAFYIFPKLDAARFNITDDRQFTFDLLHEKHILVVNGTGFNWNEPDHFRLICLPEVDILRKAVRDIGDFLSTYKQK